MDILLPRSLDEALQQKAQHPDAICLAGGTDVMVEINFGRLRPAVIIDLTRIPELTQWRRENGHLFLGAGVTYNRIVRELADFVPLVQASRSVGSPQIRNRGTVGGNLGTASPAGDALPVLAAYDAEVVLGRRRGTRSVAWNAFLTGPKTTSIAADELILGTRWKVVDGPGSFSKIGTRNAMVIAVAGLCLVIDPRARQLRVALGSVGPTILRATEAERFMAERLPWDDPTEPVAEETVREFAQLVGQAARPIDDVRGTAAYRVHSCTVLAGRALRWALEERKAFKWL